MRIVAGTLRGRSIDAPAGEGTRPTIDRVREALFSSLYSLRGGFEGAVVLDAFAGSGALGIEALSRGAAQAVFYEHDAKAANVLKRNLANCGLAGKSGRNDAAPWMPEANPSSGAGALGSAISTRVVKRDVLAAPPTTQQPPFDLLFLDPPYAYDATRVLAMVCTLAETGALADGAIIVYEHAIADAKAVTQAAEEAGFTQESSKKYGKTGITVLTA